MGVVVETNNPEEYPLGRAFMHLTGWQQYCVVQSNPFPPITMVPEGVQLTDVLGALGHIGITAYVGVLRVACPQPGETFLVSAAASGVGSIAGQIAKMQGARVIGIAGSAAKCTWVVDELGFDACIDYKTEDVAARLKELAPKGVDVFFDNVGGELLDTVLRRLALRARVVLCGDISTYDVDAAAAAAAQRALPDGQAGAHGGLQHARPLGPLPRGRRPARASGWPRASSAPASTCSKGSTARPRRSSACSRATTSASWSSRVTPDA